MAKYLKKEDYRAIIAFDPSIKEALLKALDSPGMRQRKHADDSFSYLRILFNNTIEMGSISSSELEKWFTYIVKHRDLIRMKLDAVTGTGQDWKGSWWFNKSCVDQWKRDVPISSIPMYLGKTKSDDSPVQAFSYHTPAFQSNQYIQATKTLRNVILNNHEGTTVYDVIRGAAQVQIVESGLEGRDVDVELMTAIQNDVINRFCTPHNDYVIQDVDYEAFKCVLENIYSYHARSHRHRGALMPWHMYENHINQDREDDALLPAFSDWLRAFDIQEFTDICLRHIKAEFGELPNNKEYQAQFITSAYVYSMFCYELFFDDRYKPAKRKFSRNMQSINKLMYFWTPIIQSAYVMYRVRDDLTGIDLDNFNKVMCDTPLVTNMIWCFNHLNNMRNKSLRQSMSWGNYISDGQNADYLHGEWMWHSYHGDLESLNNAYFAHATPRNINMVIVTGEDIRKYYHQDAYVQDTPRGSLWGSCMRGSSNQAAIEFFVTCGAKMLVCLDNDHADSTYPMGRLIGRAMLWDVVRVTPHYRRQKAKSNFYIKMMDRIYYSHEWVTNYFYQYAKAEGYHRKLNQSYDSHLGVVCPDDKENNYHMQICLPIDFKVNMFWLSIYGHVLRNGYC